MTQLSIQMSGTPGSGRSTVARGVGKAIGAVILDSPCLYDILRQRGQTIAANAGARYLYIECRLDDMAALDERLRTRDRLSSQVASISGHPRHPNITEETFRHWQANMSRPDGDYLLIDTAQPAEVCIVQAVAFVERYISP